MSKQTATPARPVRTTGSRQTPSRQTPTRQTPGVRAGVPTRAKMKENVPARPFQMPFDQKNMTIIFAGIGVIIIGYLVMYFSPVMSAMALTVSPIILLLGYCVIVPIGIMSGVRGNRKKSSLAPASVSGVSSDVATTTAA